MASLTFRFPDAQSAEARRMAIGLREYLLNNGVIEDADIAKRDDDTADLGSLLEIVLAGPVLVTAANQIAKGIADWIRSRADRDHVTLEIERDGEALRTTGRADEVQQVVAQWLQQ